MSKKNIVIIDYGLCNLRSVYNALRFLGHEALVTDNPGTIKTADYLVLPGVGAFEDGMKGLREKNFLDDIYSYVKGGRPFLGICLGMQMLMTKSFEFGEHQGLNLVEGEVIGFKNRLLNGHYDFKVPHISWNGLFERNQGSSWTESILSGLAQGEKMYFVHSFHAVPKSSRHILAQTLYAGMPFCSVCRKDNIYGCQFHPEKSSRAGLKILENFVKL